MFRIILCLLVYCIVIFACFNHCIFALLCVLNVLFYCTNPAFGCYILINFFSSLRLTPRLYDWSVSSVHLVFYFYFSSLVFFVVVPCGGLSWLYVSLWAHVNLRR